MIITDKTKCQINNRMFGLFFEDINYALDGGLHAEMIENRSFEFFDCGGEKYHYFKTYDGLYGWTGSEDAELEIHTDKPLNDINPHYLCFRALQPGANFTNKAYDGIFLKKGMSYHVSFYARSHSQEEISVSICDRIGKEYCSGKVTITGDQWQKYHLELVSREDVRSGIFTIRSLNQAEICFDFISMKPEDALFGVFRRDLAETLKELRPGFLRFPGGCIVEGNTLESRYQWKNSVGEPEKRKANWNRWAVQWNDYGKYSHYNQTLGVGFYEYFLLCEYLEAEALPVVNVGLACQFQSIECFEIEEQGFEECVQDALDLISFANDGTDTEWGRLRAEMGHPEPFGLKMIGIGNEQWNTPESRFFERYTAFEKAIHEKYPEIKLIGSAGPNVSSEHYTDAWEFYRKNNEPGFVYAVDEHYYVPPEWMLSRNDFYDDYPGEIKVFAGEYAAHIVKDVKTAEKNTMEAAIAEAAFLTGIERNGDVVVMASYAPLLARNGYAQWSPDLIWFNDTVICRTPNYYVQQFFSQMTGDTELIVEGLEENREKGLFVSASKDSVTGKIFIKLVNSSAEEIDPHLEIAGISEDSEIEIVVLQGSPEEYNCPDKTNTIIPEYRSCRFMDLQTLPPVSMTVITLNKRA